MGRGEASVWVVPGTSVPEPMWRRSFPIDTDRAASGYPDSASDTLDEPLLPLPDVEAAHDKDNTADTETVLKINECVPVVGLQDTCQGICHSTKNSSATEIAT